MKPPTRETPDADVALRDAFQAHYEPLVRFGVLLAGSEQGAEDLVQEAFLRAGAAIPDLDLSAQGAYLRTVVLNLWRNRLRRWRLERSFPVDASADVSSENTAERVLVWQAILRLPPRQRACLVLRYYEDFTERETAAALGCSTGTVKSQVSKAMRRMRQELQDEDE